MTINRDLSELPRSSGGLEPDPEPRFVQALVEHWRQDEIDNPHVRGSEARFWHSDAGKCARLIAYKAAEIPASDPMDVSGTNNVRLGQLIHDAWQGAIAARYGEDAENEPRVFTLDGDGTGRIDSVIRTDGRTIAYELKSIGGWGFKNAIGKAGRNKPAQGPNEGHLLQGALNAHAIGADELVIGYIAKEAISVNQSKDISELARFAAEWTFTRDEFTPLAERELARVRGILDLLDAGLLAARKIPDLPPSAEITDPATGLWEQRSEDGTVLDTDAYWGCAYCSHQTLCAQTERGRIAVESVVSITKKVA